MSYYTKGHCIFESRPCREDVYTIMHSMPSGGIAMGSKYMYSTVYDILERTRTISVEQSYLELMGCALRLVILILTTEKYMYISSV
jgi:hypothetical protein